MARPRTKPTRKESPGTVQLNIRISADLSKQLRKRAIDEGMYLKDWLPRFLLEHLPELSARS